MKRETITRMLNGLDDRYVSEAEAYLPVAVQESSTWYAVSSPYFGMDDFRWFLKQLGDMGEYFELNKQLFDYTVAFDADKESKDYAVPVYFISGSDDWICPVDSTQGFYYSITAPSKEFTLIEGCGHNVQYSLPEDFAAAVK